MADGIDILLQAANAAKEERQKSAETQNRTTQTMIDAMQKNRQLNIMQQTANTDQSLMGLKAQELELEKIKAQRMNDILGGLLSNGVDGSGGMSNVPPGTRLNVGGLSVPLNRKFTDAETKSLSTSESLQNQIDELINVIKTDKEGFEKDPLTGVLKSGQLTGNIGPAGVTERGQNYSLLKNSISERLLRLRSGAQINEVEYKRFTKMLPSIFRGDDLDVKQLQNFKDEFAKIEGRIKQGGNFNQGNEKESSDLRSEYNKLRAQGVSAADAKKRLGI